MSVLAPERPARTVKENIQRAHGHIHLCRGLDPGLTLYQSKPNDLGVSRLDRREAFLDTRGQNLRDFGRSKRDTGAYTFKKNFGFEPQPLYYEYRSRPGFTIPEGWEPALAASAPFMRARASAIWLRQEFSTHTNSKFTPASPFRATPNAAGQPGRQE